jgi:hypothetical protein
MDGWFNSLMRGFFGVLAGKCYVLMHSMIQSIGESHIKNDR